MLQMYKVHSLNGQRQTVTCIQERETITVTTVQHTTNVIQPFPFLSFFSALAVIRLVSSSS